MRRPALALLLGCLLLVAGVSALDGYEYYQTIEYAACDQEVYQQDIVIHRTTGTAYNETAGGLETWHIYVGDHCREDYGDVRFTDSTGAELAYYLWPDCTSSSARFCVRLEGADAAGSLFIWYGNPTATTTSDGDAAYLFFDTFDGDALNSNKWTDSGNSGEVTVTNGEAVLRAAAASATYYNRYITSKSSFSGLGNISVEIKARVNLNGANRYGSSVAAGCSDRSYYANGVYGASHRFSYSNTKYWFADGTSLASSVTATNNVVYRFDIYQSGTRADYYADGVRAYQGETITFSSFPYIELYISTWDAGNNPKLHIDYALVRAYSATPPAATDFSGEQETQGPPIVGFTATPTVGLAPLTVQFNDTSLRSPTSWTWDFGDGSTSTDQNPEHTYTAAGTYSVNLTVTNEYGTEYKLKPDYITVYSPVTAQFMADVTYGALPLTVQFTDASSGSPTSWTWDFGDGNTSTDQNPEHTYTSTGTYTVKLIASHPYDSDEETKVNYITVVTLQPFPGCSSNPTDPDSDGLYEDINGNGRWDFQDLVLFFQHLTWCNANQPITLFDWNSNFRCDFDDVHKLWLDGGMI
jgi:FOG: PKD repeat